MIKKAIAVIGLQFGDEGKGVVVNNLARGRSLVCRFSGGQQAGHTVMHGGKKHVFSNFGAGTLKGVPSFFTEHCTIYPNSCNREKQVLYKIGIEPTLYVHPLAALTTPYDVAYGRYREKMKEHGSCGMGVGATMTRHLQSPYKLYAADYQHPKLLKAKLEEIGKYYAKQLNKEGLSIWHTVYRKDIEDEMPLFMELVTNPPFMIVDMYHRVKQGKHYDSLILEGSQGILLDMDHGVFPYVTYANTTSKNAIEVAKKFGLVHLEDIYYVTRCYQTRHGKGWMSDQSPISLVNTEQESNKHNEWQKDFRVGELDYDLLNYSLKIDELYHQGIPKLHLVVTCMDQRPGFDFKLDRIKENVQCYYNRSPESSNMFNNELQIPSQSSLPRDTVY